MGVSGFIECCMFLHGDIRLVPELMDNWLCRCGKLILAAPFCGFRIVDARNFRETDTSEALILLFKDTIYLALHTNNKEIMYKYIDMNASFYKTLMFSNNNLTYCKRLCYIICGSPPFQILFHHQKEDFCQCRKAMITVVNSCSGNYQKHLENMIRVPSRLTKYYENILIHCQNYSIYLKFSKTGSSKSKTKNM